MVETTCTRPPRISIHALHEESDADGQGQIPSIGISIHALHEESYNSYCGKNSWMSLFQSTLSMRRATRGILVSCRH